MGIVVKRKREFNGAFYFGNILFEMLKIGHNV